MVETVAFFYKKARTTDKGSYVRADMLKIQSSPLILYEYKKRCMRRTRSPVQSRTMAQRITVFSLNIFHFHHMTITIINDCRDANAANRQATRASSLLQSPVVFVGVAINS